jgi:type IX secretion system PorP/SprF family membrane protein
MRKLLYILCIALSIGTAPFTAQGQDHHFSQVLMTPQLTNPALTGVFSGGYRVFLNYRSQWVPLGSPFKTYAGTFDMKLLKRKTNGGYLGIGGNFFKDAAGDGNFGLFQFNLNVAGVIPVGENQFFSAGISVGVGQHSVNMSSLTWGSQFSGATFDPTIASGEAETLNSRMFFDIGGGMNYHYSNTKGKFVGEDVIEFDIGGAYYHVNKPQTYFVTSNAEGLYSKMIVTARMRYDVEGSSIGWVPFAQFMQQGPHTEVNLGTLLRFKLKSAGKRTDIFSESALLVGVQMRFKAAVIPQVYLEFSGWSVGFAYDYNLTPLAELGSANGGFEVSIRYINFNEPRISSRRRGGRSRM